MSVRVNLGRGGGAEAAVVRFSRSDGVCRQCRPGMGGPAWGLGGGTRRWVVPPPLTVTKTLKQTPFFRKGQLFCFCSYQISE